MQVGIDGINVDFEKISKDCGVHYIQFIRELSVKCRQNGIVLSVDNYVPGRDIINSTIAKNRALWQTMSLLWDMMSIMEVHWKQVQYLLMNL